MKREVIAADVDEVLYPFVEAFIVHHNSQHGTDLSLADFETYEFDGPLGLSVPETVKRVYDFQNLEDLHIDPLEEAEEAVERISKVYDIAVVTARHPQFEEATKRWLKTKFSNQFHSVTSIGFAPIMEKPVTKAEVCRDLGARALIDDSLSHVIKCVETGIEGILFGDYPWNQAEQLPAGVTRRLNWQEVAEHFGV